jgi:uncharacterized protein YjdB
MRRFILAGSLCALACVGCTTAPAYGVSGIQIGSDASPNGVFVGDRVQMSVFTFDINGNLVTAPVSFSSVNPTIATVSASGLITCLAAGTGSIVVTSGQAHLTVPLQVDGNATGSVFLTPSAASIGHTPADNALALIDSVFTTLHNPARNKTVTWSTSDATKVSVDQAGTATGIAPTAGVAICATATDATSVKGCATVIVN